MKRLFSGSVLCVALMLSTSSLAAQKTIKLSVPGMNCASCPYMVEQAISRVDGIKSVEATMEDRSATVTFDDAMTNVGDIQQATAEIGYPSTVVK
ncbi:MAG: mercury resistance system periplasmic binding protein MerP [Geminicoccales bacterium]